MSIRFDEYAACRACGAVGCMVISDAALCSWCAVLLVKAWEGHGEEPPEAHAEAVKRQAREALRWMRQKMGA